MRKEDNSGGSEPVNRLFVIFMISNRVSFASDEGMVPESIEFCNSKYCNIDRSPMLLEIDPRFDLGADSCMAYPL